jgi:NADPH:quinone reductase-like Zn-dependent oxidoreductase
MAGAPKRPSFGVSPGLTAPDLWGMDVAVLATHRWLAPFELGAGTLTRSMQASAINGRVVVIGVLAGDAKVDPSVILRRRLTIPAISTGSREMFEQMNRAIAHWRLHPVIDRVFAFYAAQEAYAHLAGANHIGKVVIEHA